VWSVGAKRIEVYLAVGLALLKAPSKPLISLSHAPTLPLQAVLAQLQLLALGQGISLRNRAMSVCLSARYAPGCALPEHIFSKKGVATETDQRRFVSSQLNIPSDNLRIKLDASSPNFAAAITQGHIKTLDDWALGSGARLQVVQPLWSAITQAQRAKPDPVKALVLIEPDGMALFGQPSVNTLANAEHIFEKSAHADAERALAQIKQWQDKFQIAQQGLATFYFRETAAFRSEPGISQWLGHWEAV
jgi:hypothetical protein